jgi:hypothetical protein
LHFSNNHSATDNEKLYYGILWKLAAISAMLNDDNSKYHSHSEHDCGWSNRSLQRRDTSNNTWPRSTAVLVYKVTNYMA